MILRSIYSCSLPQIVFPKNKESAPKKLRELLTDRILMTELGFKSVLKPSLLPLVNLSTP